MTDGVLVIDKPSGMTSHDVVDEIRKRFSVKRVGHAGTLDPDATGILVVALGKATKLLPFATASDKSYTADARFGITTTTQDASGEVLDRNDPSTLTEEDVARAMGSLRADIEQIPPMVSAVRIGGERLYRKARRGEEVERRPRKVHVKRFEMTRFRPGAEANASFQITCSAGTYVRTLIHDLGAAVGCGAHMTRLRRTATSGFSEEDAVALADVTAAHVRRPIEMVRSLPGLEATEEMAGLIADGRALPAPQDLPVEDGAPVAIVDGDEVLAIYARRGAELRAKRVIPR